MPTEAQIEAGRANLKKGNEPSFERIKALAESDPEQFRKLILSLEGKTFRPHANQQVILGSNARFKTVNCGRRFGKGHHPDQPVLTPNGWSTIGELSLGDEVVGSDGEGHRVVGVYPKGEIAFYEVEFRDGSVVKCDRDHLWEVRRRWRKGRENRYEVLGVEDLLREGVTVDRADGRTERRFSVKAVAAVKHPERDLPLPPYTLGALLGDGSLTTPTPVLTSMDPQVPRELAAEGMVVNRLAPQEGKCPAYSVLGLTSIIRSLGLRGRSEMKFVPSAYLTASIEQRLAVLQGLMDTDGWLEGTGNRCAFASASRQLTEDVRSLVLSLGGKVTPIQVKPTTHLDSYVLRFYMPKDTCPFRLTRKARRWRPVDEERLARTIVDIRPIAARESICISVDAPDHLYVVNDYVLTHNTLMAAHIFVKKSRKANQMLWWIAPTYKVVKRGYAEVLKQLPDGVLAHEAPPDTNFDAGRAVILRFKNGTRMEFYSAERPEGMLGAGVDYAVLDEAAIMPGRIWNQIVRPTLMDRLGGALMISTPRGRNWFYKCWLQGQDPQQPEWGSWTFPSWTNPTLPEGEVEAMKHSMPRLEYEQEVEAKFLAAGSSTFFFQEDAIQYDQILENGLIEGCPPKGFVALGIDLARTNDYTVLYGARMRDRKNVYFERMQAITWPEQKRRIRRAVARIRKAGAENVMLLMDSTGIGDPVVEDLEMEGYDVVPIKFTNESKGNMVRLLSKDLEEAQAFVLNDGQIEEFRNYTMELSPAGRMTYSAPEGEHDDVVSAKMLSHWGCVNEGFGDMVVISPSTAQSSGSAPRNPDGEDDSESWDDLIDSDPTDDPSVAAEAVGLAPPRPPTTQELLANPDLWF